MTVFGSSAYTILVDPYWRYGPGDPFRNPATITSTAGTLALQTAGSVLNVINYYEEVRNSYSAVTMFAASMAIRDQVESQLAPGQTVQIVFGTNEAGQPFVESVDRAGTTYIGASAAPVELVARATEVCYGPGYEIREQEQFQVRDSEGRWRTLNLGGSEGPALSRSVDSSASANTPSGNPEGRGPQRDLYLTREPEYRENPRAESTRSSEQSTRKADSPRIERPFGLE